MATPFAGQAFIFRDPDATAVRIRGLGSQFGTVSAAADGYTPSSAIRSVSSTSTHPTPRMIRCYWHRGCAQGHRDEYDEEAIGIPQHDCSDTLPEGGCNTYYRAEALRHEGHTEHPCRAG